jgi:hypothetical protein
MAENEDNGPPAASTAAVRVLDVDATRGALVHLQRSALDPGTVAALKDHKDLLPRLREDLASGAGIEGPKLAEAKRISWANLLFAVGSPARAFPRSRLPRPCSSSGFRRLPASGLGLGDSGLDAPTRICISRLSVLRPGMTSDGHVMAQLYA